MKFKIKFNAEENTFIVEWLGDKVGTLAEVSGFPSRNDAELFVRGMMTDMMKMNREEKKA